MSLLIPEDLPDCVNKPVEKALTPAAEGIGKTLGDLWFLAMGGISHLADKKKIRYAVALKELKKSLENKVNAIPNDQRIEPDTQIACQALEDAKYCAENELVREMFANIIASTMNSKTNNFVHPSFSNIVKQMSVLEANIFGILKPREVYPVCEYHGIIDGTGKDILCSNVLLSAKENINLENVRSRSIALSSLHQLGVVLITYDEKTSNELYERYLQNDTYTLLNSYCESKGYILKVKKGVLGLTILGQELWNICCKDMKIGFTDDLPSSFL